MKTLVISLFCLVLGVTSTATQETETIIAVFDGYEDGIFYFTDTDGYSNAFNYLDESAQKSYDLTSDEFIGKNFQVTYTSDTEMDASDEEISIYTIVALKLLD